jgi:hypothetical protein
MPLSDEEDQRYAAIFDAMSPAAWLIQSRYRLYFYCRGTRPLNSHNRRALCASVGSRPPRSVWGKSCSVGSQAGKLHSLVGGDSNRRGNSFGSSGATGRVRQLTKAH